MRDLPDEEVFKELEGKLRGYEEEPDDVAWERIAGEIPQAYPTWLRWTDRSTLTITIVMMALAYFGWNNKNAVSPPVAAEAANIIIPSPPTPGSHETPIQKNHAGDSAYGQSVVQATKPMAVGTLEKLPTPARPDSRDAGQDKAVIRSSKPATLPAKDRKTGTGPSQAKGKALKSKRRDPIRVAVQQSSEEDNDTRTWLPVTAPAADELPIEVTAGSNTTGYSWNSDPEMQMLYFASPSYPDGGGGGAVGAASTGSSKTIIKPKTKIRRPATMYFMIMPTLPYYSISASNNDNVYVSVPGESHSLAKSRVALAFELGTQGRVYKRLSYLAGLSYYHQQNVITVSRSGLLSPNSMPYDQVSVTTSPKNETIDIEYRMNNFGLHAGLLYAITLRRWSHQAGTSIQWEYGFDSKSREYSNKGTSYYGWRAFYRLELSLSETTRIFAQPSYTGALNSDELLDGALSARYRRFGVGFGVAKDF